MPDLDAVMQVLPSLSDYPGLTLKASINSVICFGWQVFGERETRCINAWDFNNWEKSINDDSTIATKIHDVLSTADCVVTHNGKRFDWKFLQTRFLRHGLAPLDQTPHVDTCQVLKKNLFLFNNRLNTAGKFFELGQKLENSGWDLWDRVRRRDEKAMALMTRYCKQDVKLLYQLFKKILPFAKEIPNFNLYSVLDRPVCPRCGSTRVKRDGERVTRTKVMQRFKCVDCGSYCQRPKDDKALR
jgi:hypothetical protein